MGCDCVQACLMPRASDKTFSINVHNKHIANKYLSKPALTGRNKRLKDEEAFIVLHFAGHVCYETEGFLEKNNDTIHDELLSVPRVISSLCHQFLVSTLPRVISFPCHPFLFLCVR